MDIFDLMDKLVDINNESDYPQIYIQIGDTQAPLRSVKYFPESYVNYEAIVLSSSFNMRRDLDGREILLWLNTTRIPEEIAVKLGIEPKEE